MIILPTATNAPWKDGVSSDDHLPIRKSGDWAAEKHKLLTYYGKMFATAMKRTFANRAYIELFAGPGRCQFHDGSEGPGSPLQMMNFEFTHFNFIEKSTVAADALEKRISDYGRRNQASVYCGDCAEAVGRIRLPVSRCLALTFVDPTGISHCPFSLLQTLRKRVRTDLLINFPHGMGLKINKYQYTANVGQKSIVTKFLGTDRWIEHLPKSPSAFSRAVLEIYLNQLRTLDYLPGAREVIIHTSGGTPLYMLIFASRNELGVKFWNSTMKGVQDPQFPFMLT